MAGMKHAIDPAENTCLRGALLNIRNHPHRAFVEKLRRRAAVIVVSGLCMMAAGRAAGEDGDLFTPSAFSSLRYDSNYFRLSDDPTSVRLDGSRTTATNQGSALTRTAGAGLRIEKSYGLQNFFVEGTVTRYSYSNFKSLDSTGHDINGRYDFKVTPAFGGALIYKSSATPADQADTGFQTVSNIRTTTLKRLDLDLLAGAALHPRISAYEESTNSDLPLFQLEDSTIRSVSGSLIYLFPSSNTVEGYYRKARGTYQDLLPDPTLQLATSFSEQQAGARVLWVFNALSTLSADGGYLSRTHDGLRQRDFSGFVGNLSLAYQATGKTRVQLFVSRQLYSSQSDISSYALEKTATLSANWAATNVITIIPSLQYSYRNFRGATAFVPVELRQVTRGGTLEVRWNPVRQLDLSATVGHESRAATLTGYQFTNRSGELSAKLHF